MEENRKAYAAPELEKLGSVAELTLAGEDAANGSPKTAGSEDEEDG